MLYINKIFEKNIFGDDGKNHLVIIDRYNLNSLKIYQLTINNV